MGFRVYFTISIFFSLFFFRQPPVTAEGTNTVSTPKATAILQEIEKNFSVIRTLKTKFTQEKNIAVFAHPVISSGLCLFKSPDKIRLEFTAPYKSCMIVNAGQVIKYENIDGRWQKLDSPEKEITLMVIGNITSWLKGRFNDSALYEINISDSLSYPQVFLVPKSDEFKTFVSRFELEIKPDLSGLSAITIREAKNNFTRIFFHDDIINSEISNTLFNEGKNGPVPMEQW